MYGSSVRNYNIRERKNAIIPQKTRKTLLNLASFYVYKNRYSFIIDSWFLNVVFVFSVMSIRFLLSLLGLFGSRQVGYLKLIRTFSYLENHRNHLLIYFIISIDISHEQFAGF